MAISLASLRTTSALTPPRILIHGVAGVGKSTFAAAADRPVFIMTEDGLGKLQVPHFPLATSYTEVAEALDALLHEDHDFGTVVIDSIDWLEPLIWAETCKRNGWASIEAPGFGKTWHVLEFKTHGVKSFTELTAKGVVLAKPQHAAQMQIYMHLTGIIRALYVAVCKDTDALHIERIEADSAMAERLLEKAGRIIFAQHPPARISEDPAWFECRFCDHHAACHEGTGAAMTCRSCLHSTPVDGGWQCARHDRMLAPAEQRVACIRHLFIPDLVPGEVIDAGDNVVTYRMADGSTWANDARTTEAAPC